MESSITQGKFLTKLRASAIAKDSERSYRNILELLLDQDFDFHDENGNYAPHNFHAFAAKFPPQIPRLFIENLTEEGEVVLDPMVGSGTTVTEALLLNRKAIGLDLDLLAIRINNAKLSYFKNKKILPALSRVLSRAGALLKENVVLEGEKNKRFDPSTLKFLDFWFLPKTQKELLSLVLAIETEKDSEIRRMLELIFSSIIVTKSGGVSLARDLAHSRPHRDLTKSPRHAIETFKKRASKLTKEVSIFDINVNNATIMWGDARDMDIPNDSVDLIVTSPPYANAIDYMRAHKFSLVWFSKSIPELSKLRAEYIGSERIGKLPEIDLPPNTTKIISQVAAKDIKRSKILRKYYLDMLGVLQEMCRVLKPSRAAIIVIGTSTMRGINVQIHKCLAEIAERVGFEIVNIAKRKLDRNRRMMPARFKGNGQTQIENRMHEEYVIGLIKPEDSTHAK